MPSSSVIGAESVIINCNLHHTLMTIFVELAIMIVIATAVAFAMKLLRQPLIVGYIATGVIVGPYFLDLLHSRDEMELFSKIGISILLFIVGLTLNPDIVREVGKTSLVTGIGQVLFTSLVGVGIVSLLGFDLVSAAYVAVALTFSSTIIVLKLLADRGDLGKLYGKVAIGFLLVQDLIATVIMLTVTILGSTYDGASGIYSSSASMRIISLLILGLAVTIILYFISKYILPRLASLVADNQEILFVFSIAWGLGLSALFYVLGFSIEIGALIAGALLAVSPFAYEIGARMKPLRDFFILIFFILLGAQMVLSQLMVILVPALILSAFVLIGNPLIVLTLMNLLGYRNRVSFMCGLTVAQISEFSLILVALGYNLGHIDELAVSLVTLVGIFTIVGSTYLILYADPLYERLKGLVDLIILRRHYHRHHRSNDDEPEIIIFGYDRVGHDFVTAAEKVSDNYLVIDYNPRSVKLLRERDIPHRYGDAEDIEFLQEISFQSARLVVSSIPDHKVNLLLVKYYRKSNSTGIIVVTSHNINDAKELYLAGASYVVMPHYLGAHHAATMISRHRFSPVKFAKERNVHLAKLTKREATTT